MVLSQRCFAEKEEPVKGKWHNASLKITDKVHLVFYIFHLFLFVLIWFPGCPRVEWWGQIVWDLSVCSYVFGMAQPGIESTTFRGYSVTDLSRGCILCPVSRGRRWYHKYRTEYHKSVSFTLPNQYSERRLTSRCLCLFVDYNIPIMYPLKFVPVLNWRRRTPF